MGSEMCIRDRITSGSQHTSVETDSVRYVYQPLEDLYMILITTKNSNILQDIDTLHLLARAVADRCHSLEEQDILESCFEILEAFDEIVSLGYRENVTLSQVRTMLEMDSHEERIHEIIERVRLSLTRTRSSRPRKSSSAVHVNSKCNAAMQAAALWVDTNLYRVHLMRRQSRRQFTLSPRVRSLQHLRHCVARVCHLVRRRAAVWSVPSARSLTHPKPLCNSCLLYTSDAADE